MRVKTAALIRSDRLLGKNKYLETFANVYNHCASGFFTEDAIMVDAQVSRDLNFHSLSVLVPRFACITQGSTGCTTDNDLSAHPYRGGNIPSFCLGKNELEKSDHL